MSERKIIAVVGATGAQGGGLVRAILNDPDSQFTVRAITRDAQSPAAQALARAGADIVTADIDDEASLVDALRGAYGAFLVTFYWAHGSAARETQNARNLASAARTADIRHAIWSTLEDTRRWVRPGHAGMPVLGGEYNVPHMDAKGAADRYFAELGVPTTYLLTSFYWDNLISFGMGPRVGPDGRLYFALPMGAAKLPGIAAEDIGACALRVFKRGEQSIGRRIGIAGEHLTGDAMASQLSVAVGAPVHYAPLSPDAYRSFGFPGCEDLGNMFQFKRDFEAVCCGNRDVQATRALYPALQTFDTWLAKNGHAIAVQVAAHAP